MKFKELQIGDSFYFNDSVDFNSLWSKCKKISAKKYEQGGLAIMQISSINCEVYHVNE